MSLTTSWPRVLFTIPMISFLRRLNSFLHVLLFTFTNRIPFTILTALAALAMCSPTIDSHCNTASYSAIFCRIPSPSISCWIELLISLICEDWRLRKCHLPLTHIMLHKIILARSSCREPLFVCRGNERLPQVRCHRKEFF